MKKYLLLFIAIFAFSACSDDDPAPVDPVDPVDPVSETINVTGMLQGTHNWTSNNTYVLNQKVVVDAGATLNIEAGTVIKGSAGQGSLASALVVARGGMINAVGTADAPIIMTSVSDDLSTMDDLGPEDQGLWGGLLVLGYAPCSFSGDVSELQIEGIPADDTFGLYGGNDASDNSGTISYVSIRHGGAVIGADNEINGLTLGGVGNGTTINNVEVIANSDDGIEFFGGTVDVSNALVWACGDDLLDIDQAYSGTISNSIVLAGSNSDHGMEIDGPEGTFSDQFTLNNITLVGYFDAEGGEYADYRSNAMGASNNVAAYNFFAGKDVELDNDGVATNYNDGLLTFGTWEIEVPEGDSLEEIFNNKADNVTVTGFGANASDVAAGSQTVGCDTSALAWTFANAAAGLGW
ncbi:MAG: hypothetical protein CMC17_01635 [Flavobacteriaceae bacterium]|nr:hypothetical protein [Flavobacteriaceae bacterium]OUX30949.1 MAG: hypothetical protein CBE18_02140 [Pelagibacteraceae bacterium TMED258]